MYWWITSGGNRLATIAAEVVVPDVISTLNFSARSRSISRFPEASPIDRVLAQLQPLYGPLTLDPAGLYSADSSSTGTGHRLYLALERRLGDHLVLGAAGTVQRSQDYSPNTFQLYLRYTLKPWQGNLPLPVTPLVPYGEFR